MERVHQRFETETDCAAFAKEYAATRNVQAGCAVERMTFKLHVRPKGAAAWSKKVHDIVPGQFQTVDQPDVLIVEGLNILQAGDRSSRPPQHLFASDFFDFTVYVDAEVGDIRRWYIERFFAWRKTAFRDPPDLPDRAVRDLSPRRSRDGRRVHRVRPRPEASARAVCAARRRRSRPRGRRAQET